MSSFLFGIVETSMLVLAMNSRNGTLMDCLKTRFAVSYRVSL